MDFSPTRRSYLQLHVAVFLFGFTAILGDQIRLSAEVLVGWRLLFTIICLALIVNIRAHFRAVTTWQLARWTLIGLVVSLHWVTFFASIKLSNASVALICLATGTIFTSFLEPLALKTSFHKRELLLALLIVPAMALVVSDLDGSMMRGVWVGLASAILMSIFGVLNKRFVHEGNPLFITFVELTSGLIAIAIFLFFFGSGAEKLMPTGLDWVYLIILATFCTALAFVLILYAMQNLSAFTTAFAVNLEPIYGILLAYFLLDDGRELTWTFYLGGFIIMSLVVAHAYLERRLRVKSLV